MPWKEVCKVELRRLFIAAVESGEHNFTQLCSRYNISRQCGYKWLRRYRQEGDSGLFDRDRRPHRQAKGTVPALVKAVIMERQRHPVWGARKIRKRLEVQGIEAPSERTVNRILKRAGLVNTPSDSPEEPQRFERSSPNALWQMDHKGALHGAWGARVVPFVVIDDATRYCLGLYPLPDKGLASTWSSLWGLFGKMGLPDAVLSDNAPVFSGINGPSKIETRLMRLGINVLHGRPYHPQTQGKVERFNGTLQRELLQDGCFKNASALKRAFVDFRDEYNFIRPHEALNMDVPGKRYLPSSRPRPDSIPEVEYDSGATLRKVSWGRISFKNCNIEVGRGLDGERVELREVDYGIEIYYGPYRILGDYLDGRQKRRRYYQKGENN